MSSWEDELREHFPAYLLPASALNALPRSAAERFLGRLSGKTDTLELLLAASALSPVADEVRAFAKELILAARGLLSRTEVERVESEGHVRGRPDMPATLRKRLGGGSSRVVSRVRDRRFDLPENVVLAVTADRIVRLLAKLDERNIIARDTKEGWARGFRACAQDIRHALASTMLREVSRAKIEAFHEEAARGAGHPAYRLALCIHEAMKDVDTKDATAIARLVAEGALAPLDESTRFEIAVLIRLGRAIEGALSGRPCEVSRALIEENRSHVFQFSSGRDHLRIHYNQVLFKDPGPRDRGVHHYFGEQGRLRPDLTIELWRDEKRTRVVVVEVKHSDKIDYLKHGYEEALLYRFEYDKELTGWPKAILVVSSESAVQGTPRREDDAIAVSWKEWVPEIALEGLLDGFGADSPIDEAKPQA